MSMRNPAAGTAVAGAPPITFMDEVYLTSGTTTNVFGTGVTFNLNALAETVIALVVSGCDTVITTAEGSSQKLQVQSSSLGLADQEFATGPYITSGPGTNSSGQGMVQEIIPVNWPAGGNESITLATALTATNTTGKATMVGIMYTNNIKGLPQDWRGSFPLPVAVKGGYVANATQTTTTRTALTAINIPTWAREMVAVKAIDTKTGAVTTAQYQQVLFEFTSTIPNVTPLKVPSNSEGSTLGTPVGTGQYNDWIPWIPIYVKNPGGTQTITAYVNLQNAVTAANEVTFGVNWR